MVLSEEQKRQMAANLKKSFELLNTVMKLRLAYLKKMYPDKTEKELVRKIYRDIIESRKKEWNLAKS